MNVLDRIALAKAGYKKKEIEDLIANEEKTLEQVVKEDSDLDEKELLDEKEEPEKEKITENIENSENVSDKIQEELLTAFEEQKEEIANLQKQLKEAQTANTRVNMNVERVEDKEQEIIKKLMEG